MLGEEPETYVSSSGIKRKFCGSCGTSFSYEDEKLPGEVYLSVGVFDEPEKFEPQGHSWFSSKVSWLHIEDAASQFEESSRPR